MIAGGAVRHAVVATRWSLLAASGVAAAGCVVLVSRWPAALWPLHGAALGLLTGAAAAAVDERCAAVVDTAPRPLWWRTAGRAVVPVALAVVWVVTHALVRDRLPDHLDVLVLQGVVAVGLGFAVATASRVRGRGEPGQALAAAVVPLVLGAALARPFEAELPLFPVWPHEDWRRAALLWAAGGVVAVVVGGWALWSDARSRSVARSGGMGGEG